MSFLLGSQKFLQELVSHELATYLSVFNLILTQWIKAMLSKGCKPDNFESHNFLKLSFINIWGLHSNFVECESFLESNSPDILALCEINLDDSFWQFRGESLSSFNLKRLYYSYAWSCSLCERRTSFCAGRISRKLCRFLCFQLVLLHSMINFFFLHQLPSSLLSTVFDNIEHIYMISEVNSNQIEISLWGKISLQCKVTSLLAFTQVQVKWNSLQCKFHFGQFEVKFQTTVSFPCKQEMPAVN